MSKGRDVGAICRSGEIGLRAVWREHGIEDLSRAPPAGQEWNSNPKMTSLHNVTHSKSNASKPPLISFGKESYYRVWFADHIT